MKKSKLIQLRVTEQEVDYIALKMVEHDYKNRSQYILDSAISPIKHNRRRQLSMLSEVNKIGVNLNQVARKMHKEKSINQNLSESINATRIALIDILKIYGGV